MVQLRLHGARVLCEVHSNLLTIYFRAWLPLLLLQTTSGERTTELAASAGVYYEIMSRMHTIASA